MTNPINTIVQQTPANPNQTPSEPVPNNGFRPEPVMPYSSPIPQQPLAPQAPVTEEQTIQTETPPTTVSPVEQPAVSTNSNPEIVIHNPAQVEAPTPAPVPPTNPVVTEMTVPTNPSQATVETSVKTVPDGTTGVSDDPMQAAEVEQSVFAEQ